MRVREWTATGYSWRDEGPSRVRLGGWAGQMIVGGVAHRDPSSAQAVESRLRREAKKRLEDLTKADYQKRAAKGWTTRRGA